MADNVRKNVDSAEDNVRKNVNGAEEDVPMQSELESFNALVDGMKAGDAADKYAAVATVLEKSGDHEMADLMRTLSCQMVFDGNEVATPAIERTKKKVMEAIRERKSRHYKAYLGKITDEEILAVSDGEVTQGATNVLGTSFVKGGLYDPDIFGGDGSMPVAKSGDKIVSTHKWGPGMGHIELPVRVIDEKDLHTVADILGIHIVGNYDEIVGKLKNVTRNRLYIVTASDDDDYAVGSFVEQASLADVKENHPSVSVATGADTLYEMMKAKNFSDHPERIAYRVVPVVSPFLRPFAFCTDIAKTVGTCLGDAYETLISRCMTLRRMMSIGVPDVIMSVYIDYLYSALGTLYRSDFKDGSSLVQSMKRLSKNRGNRVLVQQAMMTLRSRVMFYDRREKHVLGPIADCGYYPKAVTVREEDGTESSSLFEEIYNVSSDAFFDWSSANAVVLPSEDESEWDDAAKEAVNDYNAKYDIRDGLLTDLLADAHAQQDRLVVMFDEETGMYVPVS